MNATDLAALVVERRKLSFDWQRQNFYDQWRKVHKLYKCEVDAATDENTGNVSGQLYGADGQRINSGATADPTKTRIGMPDTWSLVQRQVARITAQPPNLKFRADDLDLAKKISRKLMWDWDRGGVQRMQKRHVAQACLFGISVRAWSWETIEYPRTRRVDPLAQALDEGTRSAIHDQYGEQLGGYQSEINADLPLEQHEPFGGPTAMAKLMGDHSRGNLLPIKETFKKYQGPKANFLFIGDCFFEPNFQDFQSQNWFIVERRRNKPWLIAMAKRYEELADGIDKLLTQRPQGSPPRTYAHDAQSLRTSMMGDIDRIDSAATSDNRGNTPEWTVTEMWTPGEESKVCFVGEDSIYLGEIQQPYDLDGKIPFTAMVLIDDILSGVGDSNARIIRGLNELHNMQVSRRADLYDAILRPLIVTNDLNLYENPLLLRRGDGFRLVYSGRGGSALQGVNEAPAQASAAASIQGTEEILRMIQSATGESNMSMNANVDPAQNKTATGSRLQAFNQDILSKSVTDMANYALREDADMMYLLNRSEMPETVTFDAARYSRTYSMGVPPDLALPVAIGQPQAPEQPAQPGVPPKDMMSVSPLDFQIDGEVEAEVGSTLADDDDAEVAKAGAAFDKAVQFPNLFNVQYAAQNLLVRLGYAKDLAQWQPPPPQPPAPEQPKVSFSVAMKFELLPLDVQVMLLEKAAIQVPPELLAKAAAMQVPGAPQPEVPETAAMPTMTPPHPGPPQAPPGAKPSRSKANGKAPETPSGPPTALDAAEGIRMPTQ